jgi:hypothetical protein
MLKWMPEGAVIVWVVGLLCRLTKENSDLWLTFCWGGLIFAVLALAAAIQAKRS